MIPQRHGRLEPARKRAKPMADGVMPNPEGKRFVRSRRRGSARHLAKGCASQRFLERFFCKLGNGKFPVAVRVGRGVNKAPQPSEDRGAVASIPSCEGIDAHGTVKIHTNYDKKNQFGVTVTRRGRPA